MTTVSPSRTSAATASRMVATFEPAVKRSRSSRASIMPRAMSTSSGADHQRRRQAERALSRAQQQEAPRKAPCTSCSTISGAGSRVARSFTNSTPTMRPDAAHVADAAVLFRQPADAGLQPLAHGRRRWP